MPTVENKQIMLTRAKYQSATIREDDKSVEFVLSTDNPALMYKEGLGYVEESLMPGGAVFSNDSIPLLDCHDRYSIDKVLGSVREFRVENDKLIGRLYFADTEEGNKAFDLVRNGHLTSGSVGYYRIDSVWIPENESTLFNGRSYAGPLLLTKKWGLDEFSLVPIPADKDATVRGKNDNGFNVIDENNKKELTKMSKEKQNEQVQTAQTEETKTETVVVDNGETLERAKQEACIRERERITAINNICSKFSCNELATRAINENMSIEQVNSLVLDELGKRSVPLSKAKSNITFVADEKEKFIRAVSDGLLLKAGLSVENAAAGAEDFRGYSLINVAQAILQRNGDGRIRGNAETLDIIMRAGSQSYDDFSYILDTGVNKAVMVGYRQAPTTWRTWAKKGSLDNLEPSTRVGISDIPAPQLNKEGSEIKRAIIGDKGEQVQLATYANEIKLTRRAILADNLSLFNDIATGIGARCAQLVESMAYGVLKANGNMSDGQAVFSAAHSNLMEGGVLSKDTLKLAFAAMQKQQDFNGTVLNLIPRYLICSADDALMAEVLTTSINDVSSNPTLGNTNFFRNRGLTAIGTAFIAQSDGYFLIADPAYGATVEIDFLGGKESPTIMVKDNADNVLGRSWTYYFDVGAKAIDFRTMNKTPYSAG